MGVEWRFFINDDEIAEPIGWSEIEFSLIRDQVSHGIGHEASTSELKFWGVAFEMLEDLYITDGLKANAVFLAEMRCRELDDFEQVIKGRLNFGQRKKACGKECTISLPVEVDTCEVVLKTKFDQKVDVDKLTGIDNFTAIADYAAMNLPIELPAVLLQTTVEGFSLDDFGDIDVIEDETEAWAVDIRPSYTRELYNSIVTGQLTPTSNYYQFGFEGLSTQPMSPQLLFEDNPNCFPGSLDYTFVFNGRISVNSNGLGFSLTIFITTWDGAGHTNSGVEPNIDNDGTVVQSVAVFSTDAYFADTVVEFDETITGSIALASGIGLYGYIQVAFFDTDNDTPTIHYEFDEETYVLISATKQCPPSETEGYLVHELASRVSEAITNGCVRVKSEYFGRTDSQPFSFDQDGCGSLRMLTSGLKIRNATEAKFFISLKQLLEGLNAIDNIGWDVIADTTIPGRFILRIEDVPFFYLDQEMIVLDSIPEAVFTTNENKSYSKILVGYKKWEIENVNGLTEPNSNREYYTSIETVSNTIDVSSGLVAGSTAIEITRQQQFADSGAADTTYDNEAFIICLYRTLYNFFIEQGNVINAQNLFSPETLYNFRITPLRNLMRWFKSIINSYTNLGDSQSKLFFAAGTGNHRAIGELGGAYVECKLENAPISEQQDLWTTNFANQSDYTPRWRNENVTFKYPLSLGQYNAIKASPYGYISFQCGNGEFQKGYINEIKWSPVEGIASFNLRLKW